jgi:acetyltransferase-like isoleucine patch superfamily enzyme
MVRNEFSTVRILKRLYWDFSSKNERKHYFYWLISNLPGGLGNMLRARFCAKNFRKAGERLNVLAGTRFRSMENLEVGENVMIGNDNFIQALGGVSIGNDVSLGPGVKIWSVNHVFEQRDLIIEKQGLVKMPVFIGNDVWIGSNAFICPGVNIPNGVVVAAGSVLTKQDYKPYSVVAGNPARTIKFRESREKATGNSV